MRHLLSAGIMLAALLLAAPELQAGVFLGVSDLPGVGETLNVNTDTVTIQIHSGETGTIAGTISVTGTGILLIENAGTLISNGFSLQTFAANSTINNTGRIEGSLWTITDQFDETLVTNLGVIDLSQWTLVANGGLSLITVNNAGTIMANRLSVDMNYGGTVVFNTLFGSTYVDKLDVDASGSSHGHPSTFDVRGSIQVVPEPSSLWLLPAALASLAVLRRRP